MSYDKNGNRIIFKVEDCTKYVRGEADAVGEIEQCKNDNAEMIVYPNPTNGILNVSGNITNVAIFDVVGRKVYAQGVVENVIDLSYLSKGNYYIIANKDGKMVKTSVIIL